MERGLRDCPEIDPARLMPWLAERRAQIERGDFHDVHAWLREKVYAHGRKFTPAEAIERVVGGPIDPEPYLRYLREKLDLLARA